MRILMTGATGYIGHAVAEALTGAGHRVVGLARSDAAARTLEAAGHEVREGDLRDLDGLEAAARDADAVVHAAATGTGDQAAVDVAATRAVLRALSGTGRPFVYTSGCFVIGDTGETAADEDTPLHPADVSRHREGLEREVLGASRQGVRGVVLRPAFVYGRGGGIPGELVQEAADSGRVRVVGDGWQEWPLVHVDDLADLYARALNVAGGTLLHAAAGPSLLAWDVALAACWAAGSEARPEPWPLAAAREELGAYADALALTQRMSGGRARSLTGWSPSAPSLLAEMLTGSYATTEEEG